MLKWISPAPARISRQGVAALCMAGVLALAVPTCLFVALAPESRAAGQEGAGDDDVQGANARIEYLPEPSAAERKILAALDRTIEVDFQEASIQNVIAYLSDKSGVAMVLPPLSGPGWGVIEKPVTLKSKEMTVRSVLRHALGPMDLQYAVTDDALKISTGEDAVEELLTRTYPVGDLCEAESTGSVWARKGKSLDDLTKAISSSVAPPTWSDKGGPARISAVPVAKSLVIHTSYPLHEQVLELLRALRAAKAKQATGTGVVPKPGSLGLE